MALIYKILCEVKLMHEYYLTGSKGENIFDFAAQSDRIDFLFQQFKKDGKVISNDVEFEAPVPEQQIYKDYYLRILPSYSGFKIAVRCNRKILADGTTVFQPFVSLPDNLSMMVSMNQKNSIAAFSNTTVKQPFTAAFYFSNDNFPSAKIFPFLAEPVPAFDAVKVYEQGEIASFGAGDIRVFLNNGEADPWLPLTGTGYVSGSDRLLVPLSFNYTFSTTDNVTNALFVLKDAGGNEVKSIAVSENGLLKAVRLNFRTDNNSVITLPGTNTLYTLEVSASNGYSKSFSLLFADDTMNISTSAGIISLKPKTENPAFNLTDADGYLQTRILPDSSVQQPPIFELWMKSRLVYWSYCNNKRKKIKLTTDTQDVLADDSGVLITKNPLPLSFSPVLLKKPDSTFQYLPNPLPGDAVIKVEGSKVFIKIPVPESAMFPLA